MGRFSVKRVLFATISMTEIPVAGCRIRGSWMQDKSKKILEVRYWIKSVSRYPVSRIQNLVFNPTSGLPRYVLR
jgi:hypothetical protein